MLRPLITEGTAKLLKMLPYGRQQITSFAGEGDFLGLAVDGRSAYSAEALNRMKVCRFSRARLRQLFAAFPHMERRLLARACHELVLAQEQMLLLGRKSARERMASFLITRAGAENPPGSVQVVLPMNRNDIGDYLGLSTETVSRCLTQLKLKGVISIAANHGIVVRDMAALEGLSGSA